MGIGVEQRDVERIIRDVLNAEAYEYSLLGVEAVEQGWRVTVRDATGRGIACEFRAASPAALRAAVDQWLDWQS